MKSFAKIVSYFALLLLVLGIIGFVFAFVNNGQKNFYVQFGNTKITAKTEIEVPKDCYSLFFCKNVLAFSDETANVTNFTVSIEVNRDKVKDFDFTLNGQTANLYGENDFAQAFDLGQADNYFWVYVPAGCTMADVLQAAYPGERITNVPDIPLTDTYFQLVVYAESENVAVYIPFK